MASTEEPTEKPSQAEGERDIDSSAQGQATETEPVLKPSQAEGDRATIETDIRQKEQQGQL